MLNLKASRTIYTVFTALPPLSLLFFLFDALFFFLSYPLPPYSHGSGTELWTSSQKTSF